MERYLPTHDPMGLSPSGRGGSHIYIYVYNTLFCFIAVKALLEQDPKNQGAMTLYDNIRRAIQTNQKVLRKKYGEVMNVLPGLFSAHHTCLM